MALASSAPLHLVETLSAAGTLDTSTGLQSDEFDSGALDPTIWNVVDPVGDTTVTVTGGALRFAIPARRIHDLWTGANLAPRVLQSAPDEDLEVVAKFDSVVTTRTQMQGFVFAQDFSNLLRFDIHHDGSGTQLLAAAMVAGTASVRHTSPVPAGAAAYLRVRRSANTWTISHSPDGTTWTSAPPFEHALTLTSVGLFAGTSGSPAARSPAFTAVVDFFRVSSSPPADTTPPVIAGLAVSAGASSATVAWTTNEPADSRVEFGLTSVYGETRSTAALVTGHAVALNGLSCGATYHYRASSADGAGNRAHSGNLTFATSTCPPPDTTPPVITAVAVTAGSSSATLTWTTDEPASSRVDYGPTASLGETRSSPSLVTGHNLAIPGLACATTYYFRVSSADAAGNGAHSADGTFATTACSSGTGGVRPDEFNTGSLDPAVWTVMDPLGDTTITATGTALRIEIPGRRVHDLWTGANLAPRVLQTAPDADIEVVAKFDTAVTTNTQMQGFVFVQDFNTLLRVDIHHDGFDTRLFAAALVAGSASTRHTSAVAGGAPAYLRVSRSGHTWTISHSRDGSSWTSAPPFVQPLTLTGVGLFAGTSGSPAARSPAFVAVIDYFRVAGSVPSDTTPPVITGVAVTPGVSSATVTWSTDEPADSRVEYGVTAAYGQSRSAAALVTSHSLGLTDLTCGTTYHFRVSAADAASNIGQSPGGTFSTAACADTTPPVITSVAVNPGVSSATVTWATNEPANSRVDYGLTAAYGLSGSTTELVISHSLGLTDLTCGTTYHFRVSAADAAGNLAVGADGTFATSACPSGRTIVTVDNPALAFSPYNWVLNGSVHADAVNTGAYIKTRFTGTSCHLLLDPVTLPGPSEYLPTIRYRIDQGEWIRQTLPAGAESLALATNLTPGTHTLELWYVASTTGGNRWSAPNAMLRVAGLSLDEGAAVSAPALKPGRAVIFGDSIVEGYAVLGQGGATGWDASQTWIPLVTSADRLSAEVGIVGWNAQGWAKYAVSGVPRFHNPGYIGEQTWRYIYDGMLRSWAPAPDFVFINMGTNDVDAAAVEALVPSWVTAIRASLPLTTVYVVVPFGGQHRAAITAGFMAYQGTGTADARARLIDLGASGTATIMAPENTADGIHPNSVGHQLAADLLWTAISGSPDTIPPVIAGVTTSVSASSATVTWVTDEPADAVVEYGPTLAYGETRARSQLLTAHSINLTGLLCETTYHFRVSSADVAGNRTTTADASFTTAACGSAPGWVRADDFAGDTLDTTVWRVVNPLGQSALSVAGGYLRIALPAGIVHDLWTDQFTAPRILQRVADADFDIEARFDSAVTQNNQAQGLVAQGDFGALVRFEIHWMNDATRIFAATFVNGGATVRVHEFVAPMVPVYLRMQRTGSIWTLYYSNTGTTWATAASFTLPMALTDYGVFAANPIQAPAFTALVDYFRVLSEGAPPPPTDTTPPVITGLTTSTLASSATVSWTTDEPADSVVDYGPTAAYGQTQSRAQLLTAHSMSLTGLLCETTYHFRVSSADAAGNRTTTGDGIFTTSACGSGPGWVRADDFAGETLDTTVWRVVNPLGQSVVSVAGGHLRIALPAGTAHDLWEGNLTAPRVLQRVADADFDIEAKFDSAVGQANQSQGLVAQGGIDDVVRFEIHWMNDATRIFAATIVNGGATVRVHEIVAPAVPVYLRMQRVGATWTLYYSHTGTTWTTAASFTLQLALTDYGVFAGNPIHAPAFTALVDYFRVLSEGAPPPPNP